MEMYRDVELNGQRFQVGRMTARNGSWVAAQIFTKILPAAVAGPLRESGIDGIPGARSEITESEFQNLQDHCLMVCGRYEMVGSMETAMPIMPRPGVFAVKELEYDLITILALTIHALVFNISPFFEGDGLKQMMNSFKGLNLSGQSE